MRKVSTWLSWIWLNWLFLVGRIPNRRAESLNVAVWVFLRRLSTYLMRSHVTYSCCPSCSRSRPLELMDVEPSVREECDKGSGIAAILGLAFLTLNCVREVGLPRR